MRSPLGGGILATMASSTSVDADARFGAGEDGFGGVDADDVLDLVADLFGLGGGEVDLVDDGDDLVVVLDRLVDVCEGLRLDALRGVHDQQRAFASGQAAADLVGEVDMAGRIHEVELIGQPVARSVLEPNGLRLDGNPPFALDIHVIKHLLAHLTLGQPARSLDQPVGKRRLAMVDVGDDGKVADAR